MTRPIRMLLAFVLALAIPLQGFAAASMLLCGPGHGGRSATLAAGGHHGARAADHHGAAGANEHGAAHHEAATGANGASIDAADADSGAARSQPELTKPAKLAGGKCSVCASCCSGCAIVDTLPPHAASVARDECAGEPAAALIGIVPPLLERPPRT